MRTMDLTPGKNRVITYRRNHQKQTSIVNTKRSRVTDASPKLRFNQTCTKRMHRKSRDTMGTSLTTKEEKPISKEN